MYKLYDAFSHWNEKGAVWFYSDPHFGDEEMKHLRPNYMGDEWQIKSINSKVGKHDTLVILGDVGDIECARKLKGYKVLVCGNHDAGASKYKEVFNEVYEGPVIITDKIILSHEPIFLPFMLNIHGHDHSQWNIGVAGHLNCCAELIGYTPINLNDIVKSGMLKEIKDIHRVTIDNATARKFTRSEQRRMDLQREF